MSLPKLNIIKVGGAVVEDAQSLRTLIRQFAALDGAKVLVHGGGRSATAMAARLGLETTMVGGRRVTDADMLEVVTMVYGGLVNKQVVALLQAEGVNAVGLTGADLDCIRSRKRPATPVDYGFVGDVTAVNGKALCALLREGFVPVMAPLTHDGNGQLLNTNADTIAAEVAKSLAASFDVTLNVPVSVHIYNFAVPDQTNHKTYYASPGKSVSSIRDNMTGMTGGETEYWNKLTDFLNDRKISTSNPKVSKTWAKFSKVNQWGNQSAGSDEDLSDYADGIYDFVTSSECPYYEFPASYQVNPPMVSFDKFDFDIIQDYFNYIYQIPKYIEDLTVEELLKVISAEQLLEIIPKEDLLKHLSSEDSL